MVRELTVESVYRHIPAARLTMPRTADDLLPREVLQRRIGDWRAHRLITVAAPAGYGKTMFAAQLLTAAQQQRPDTAIAWLTAAADDDDLLDFVVALYSALQPVLPAPAQQLLTAALLRGRAERAAELLLAQFTAMPSPTVIVIDDLHQLTDAAVLAWLARAIELSPPSVHWFLLSRQQLPDALARIRLRGDSCDLTKADLVVTRAELHTLLSRDVQQPIADELLDQLEARIQGWFAALQLARVLAQYSQLPPPEALARLPSALQRRQHLLVGYLSSEIIAHLSLDLRDFLLKCAILPYLQAELCAAVAEMSDAEQQLRRLADVHLLVSAHDGPGDSYVLHQLLREALLDELRRRRSAAQVRDLYQRAADWFVARRDYYAALRMLLDAGLMDAAVDLLCSVGRRLFRQTRMSELQQLFRLLTPEQISNDSDLLQLHAWVLFGVGDFTQLRIDMRRLELLCRVQPFRFAEGEDDFRALSVVVRLFNPEHDGLREQADAALAAVQPTSYHARGWLHLLRVVIAKGDESDDPIPSLEASREAFQRADSLLDVVFTTGLQVILLRNCLAVDQALRVIREVQQRLDREQRTYLADENGIYLLTIAAEIAFWRDDVADTRVTLWRLRSLAERYNSIGIQLETYLRLRACSLVQPFDAAGQALLAADAQRQGEWWQVVHREATIAVRSQCVLLSIEADYRLGRHERIWPMFQQLGLDQVSDDAPDLIWQVYFAAHVLARRDLERLTPLFERMRQRYSTHYKQYQYLRLSVWFCLQQLVLGQLARARELMREILPTVERVGFRRLILELPELAPLLKSVGTRAALSLLEAMRAQPAQAVLLSPQQQRMVELIVAGADNARIAAEFAITIGTVKWHLNRLYRLLNVRDRRELLERAAEGRLGLPADV